MPDQDLKELFEDLRKSFKELSEKFKNLIETVIVDLKKRMETAEIRLKERDRISYDLLVSSIQDQLDVQKYKARAYRATSVQSIANASFVKIQLNAESYDGEGEFDSTTNYRYTATKAGYYLVAAAIRFDTGVDTKYVIAIIRRSGSDVAISQNQSAGNQPISATVTDVVYLTAGQYLELFVYQSTAGAVNLSYGSEKTFMAIHRIS